MKIISRTLPLVMLVTILGAASTASAKDNGRISGTVLSKGGGALLGAIITVFRENRDGGTISFTRTDSKGAYSLANLTPGSYYLQVARDGYEPVTKTNIKIDPGRTTSVNVMLEEFLSYISKDDDSRNWDIKTVMRSSSDRRLIFRDLPGGPLAAGEDSDSPFSRSGAVNVASGTDLSSENYSSLPTSARGGIVSNFAFTQPVTQHGRIIFSGQLNSGYASFWRVRDTYNYRPDSSHDYRVSVGYGRQNFSSAGESSVLHPSQFFSQDPSLRESGVESIVAAFEATDQFLDIMSVAYGFDYSRLYYGVGKNIFSPYFQIEVSPSNGWTIKTALTSKRLTDMNSVNLPDGELLNLAEPTFVTKSGSSIQYSQFKHMELAVRRNIASNSSVDVGVFEDSTRGPGLPFLMSTSSGAHRHSQIVQTREDQSGQRGVKVAVNSRFLDFLTGSVAYVYGTGTSLTNVDNSLSTEAVTEDLLNLMQQSCYHSVTSQLSANLPRTKTNLTTIVRWYPGNPVTPVDLFADRMDILTKGVSFRLRQPIPLPEFMGSVAHWEALIDVRNLFDQGQDLVHTSDGDVVVTRTPRSLRFGLNLNFF